MGHSSQMHIEEMQKQEAETIEQKQPSIVLDLIHRGVIRKITNIPSKFGFSWIIQMENDCKYYFNAKTEGVIGKYFQEGKSAAFTCTEKTGLKGQKYFVVKNVFFCF